MAIGPDEKVWWCEACGNDLPDRPASGGYSPVCSASCRKWLRQDYLSRNPEYVEARKRRNAARMRRRYTPARVQS